MPYLTCPECRLSLWEPTTEKADEPCPRCLARRNAHSPLQVSAGPERRFQPRTMDPRGSWRAGVVLQTLRRRRGVASERG